MQTVLNARRNARSLPASSALARYSESVARVPRALLRLGTYLAVCLMLSFAASHAQTVVSTTNPAPVGVAVDTAGNIYYVSRTASNIILKATPTPTGYIETKVFTSASNVTGNVGIDASGALYVIEGNKVVKVSLGAGETTIATITGPSTFTSGLTVDVAGNVYATTSTSIVKISAAGNGASTLISGLSSPSSVGVDSSGNLYIVEAGNSRTLKETLAGGGFTQSVLMTGLIGPQGLVVDARGNVYVADIHHIYKAVPNAGGYSLRLFGYFDAAIPEDVQPQWLAVTLDGNTLYVEGQTAGQPPLLAFPASSVDATTLQFNGTTLGSSASQTLTYTFFAAATLGSYRVTTLGSTALDFTDAGGGTCAAGKSYAAGASCTVAVTFTPKHAGTRAGAVTLVDTAGVVIADVPVSGTGTGPQIAFVPATATQVRAGSISYSGVAVDGNGVVYLSDAINQRVLKEAPAAGGTYTETVIASGLRGPAGIAVDGAGNLYVTDYPHPITEYRKAIALKFTPNASNGYTQTTLATGLNTPTGVTVDATGNVYISDILGNGSSGGVIVRLAPLPGGRYLQAKIAEPPSFGGIAVDGAGTVYTADGNGLTAAVPTSTGQYTTSVFASGNVSPNGSIAVDGAGDVYVSGTGSGANLQISRVKADGNGNYAISISAGSGIITVDGGGSVYGIGAVFTPARTVSGVYKADQETPPTITFSSVAVGSTYGIPTVVQLANIGTSTLHFAVPANGTNPAISANFLNKQQGYSDGCSLLSPGSTAFSLAPGAECRDFVDFAPTASGPITGKLITVDDNRNVAGSTQKILLNGTGAGGSGTTAPQAVLSPTTGSFGSVTVGSSSSAITFTLSNAGNAPLPITSVGVTGTNATSFTMTGITCGTSLAAGASCTVAVTFNPSASGNAVATLSVNDSLGTQSAVLSGAGTTVAAPQAGLTPATAAFGSVNTGGTSSPQVFTVTNGGNASLTITSISLGGGNASSFTIGTKTCGPTLAAGASCTIQVSFSPSVAGSASASLSVVDSVGTQSSALTGTGISVAPPIADFNLSVANALQTIQRGATATYTIQLLSTTPGTAFTSAVALTATDLPNGATASFSPASLVPGTTQPAAATMSITVPTQASYVRPQSTQVIAAVFSFASLLVLLPLRRRKIAFRLLTLLVAMLLCTTVVSGCGSSDGAPTSTSTSTIAVTGTAGALSHSTSVTLNIK
jgi:sugar lactone lactonase YvrE